MTELPPPMNVVFQRAERFEATDPSIPSSPSYTAVGRIVLGDLYDDMVTIAAEESAKGDFEYVTALFPALHAFPKAWVERFAGRSLSSSYFNAPLTPPSLKEITDVDGLLEVLRYSKSLDPKTAFDNLEDLSVTATRSTPSKYGKDRYAIRVVFKDQRSDVYDVGWTLRGEYMACLGMRHRQPTMPVLSKDELPLQLLAVLDTKGGDDDSRKRLADRVLKVVGSTVSLSGIDKILPPHTEHATGS